MKFTLSWLKDHLDTNASLQDIEIKLSALGLEVEEVIDRAATYAAFKVAHVVSAEKHPDADKLKVLIVDTGKEKLQVVCGAPNARAGMKGIFAPDGSFIPGTGITLKKGVIRGQESNGMMVSEREMGLSDEHNGIIDLPADAKVGTPFNDIYHLDDPIIDVAITPDRADCTGVRGIARDLAAAGLGTLKPLPYKAIKGSFKSPISVDLKTDACPHFAGRLIRGVLVEMLLLASAGAVLGVAAAAASMCTRCKKGQTYFPSVENSRRKRAIAGPDRLPERGVLRAAISPAP